MRTTLRNRRLSPALTAALSLGGHIYRTPVLLDIPAQKGGEP